jgi:hypothetical protein
MLIEKADNGKRADHEQQLMFVLCRQNKVEKQR